MREPSDLGRNLLAIFAMMFIASLEYLKGSTEWDFRLSIICIAGLGGFTAAVDLYKVWKGKL